MKYLFSIVLLTGLCCIVALGQQKGKEEEHFPQAEHALPEEGVNGHTLIAPDAVETTRSYKSGAFLLRRFDEHKWQKIVDGINYTEEPLQRPEPKTFGPWTGALLRVISYTIIVTVLVFLVYYVGRYVSSGLKIQRTKPESEDLEKPVEDIETVDIRQLLDQAKRDGNYKLAVRLYYLDLLKKLNEKGVIAWKKDKTNREYLSELFSANFFFEDIRRLTLSYEAVWYGDHNLHADSFAAISTRFENIHSKISTQEKT